MVEVALPRLSHLPVHVDDNDLLSPLLSGCFTIVCLCRGTKARANAKNSTKKRPVLLYFCSVSVYRKNCRSRSWTRKLASRQTSVKRGSRLLTRTCWALQQLGWAIVDACRGQGPRRLELPMPVMSARLPASFATVQVGKWPLSPLTQAEPAVLAPLAADLAPPAADPVPRPPQSLFLLSGMSSAAKWVCWIQTTSEN